MIKKQIIAIGGNTGLSLANQKRKATHGQLPKESVALLAEDDFKLEKYILEQSGKPKPRVCYLATAVGDDPLYYEIYYELMKKFECVPTHVSLYWGTSADLRSQLLNQDVIIVNGGNTRNMIALWREWGVDLLLREAYQNGIVLAGWSAGSICWFEEGVTDSIPGDLTSMKCLGFLKGSNCPHYDGDPLRRPSYHRLMLEGKISGGVAEDDRVALHYVDGKLQKVFSNSSTGKAFSVELIEENGQKMVRETELK